MTYVDFIAVYCESCGNIENAPDIDVDPPVHRIDMLEALGGVENPWVGETVATEEHDCDLCGGQVVKRYYTVGDVPELQYDIDELPDSSFVGRDPVDDALIGGFPDGSKWREAKEISWLEDNGD